MNFFYNSGYGDIAAGMAVVFSPAIPCYFSSDIPLVKDWKAFFAA